MKGEILSRTPQIAAMLHAFNVKRDVELCEFGDDEAGPLMQFVRQHWHILEPVTPLVEGWALHAMCEHLEAVTAGSIKRLLINVPPGSMKSLLSNVFWPAWEWGAMNLAHLRTLNFSYASHLTERDNARFRDLITSKFYQERFGNRFRVTKAGETRVGNNKTGWKIASSVGGVSTGERGDRVTLDDPHNVKQGESDVIRTNTVEWFGRSMSNRLNDMQKSSILVIMQRVHESDVSGYIMSEDLGYEHLLIPAEYDGRRVRTIIGWDDPRTKFGDIFWPERFPMEVLDRQKRELGPFSYSGQYQQAPEPLGGGILKREWWQDWDDDAARLNGVDAGVYPAFSYIVASLDTAYTEKKENDPSALTVWGVWQDRLGVRRMMLMAAWAERLEFDGLVNKVAETCKMYRVSRILIEDKAAGHPVAQELRRRYLTVGASLGQSMKTSAHGDFAVQLVTPNGDKVARAYSVQPLFSNGMVFAPKKEWAERVQTECSIFPKGAHDDLVDSTTMALNHLRLIGLASLPDERAVDEFERSRFKSQVVPLYAV